MTSAPAPRTLLTFAPMIDSELCRLLLDRYGVTYQEEPHLFGWASLLSLRRGGTLQVPLLYGGGLRLAGPRAMVDHFEPTCLRERKLLPARQPLRTQVEADWQQFHGPLADDTAALAYFHLLPHRTLTGELFARGVPPGEASALDWAYPLLRGAFTFFLRLGPGRAADALTRIRMACDVTDARLADGRPFMNGDALTLSDLALATALAPVLLPDGYRSPHPRVEDLPPTMRAVVAELRKRRTAHHVGRIYAACGSFRRPSDHT
ncbi:hypothetical protein [Muricoccus radiodurans]|uniref:hypothetical protein n=1 Tax=Muricoccus radiodurans TaxID=2231721 RepID=UPI003CF10CE8